MAHGRNSGAESKYDEVNGRNFALIGLGSEGELGKMYAAPYLFF